MSDETKRIVEDLRKGCEAAAGQMVTVKADDILALIRQIDGNKPPTRIESRTRLKTETGNHGMLKSRGRRHATAGSFSILTCVIYRPTLMQFSDCGETMFCWLI